MSESRPAPDWAGDVSLGVKAWVGETPPTPSEERPFGERRSKGRGRKGGRGRTKTWAERDAAKAAAAEARTAEVQADPEGVGRTILLDSLTGQARTRKELADKLAKREVPDEVATELLDRFTEVGLIDDSAYARQWVESRHRSRGLAPRALAQELRRKGVGDEEAKEALEQIDEDDQRVGRPGPGRQEAPLDGRPRPAGRHPPARRAAGPQGLRRRAGVLGGPGGARGARRRRGRPRATARLLTTPFRRRDLPLLG